MRVTGEGIIHVADTVRRRWGPQRLVPRPTAPTALTTTATTRTAITSVAISIDTDTRRAHADGGWASPYRRPPLLRICATFRFQNGLIQCPPVHFDLACPDASSPLSHSHKRGGHRGIFFRECPRTHTASKLSSISAMVLTPHNPMVVSISLARMSSALATPASPPAPRP
jgi:hypothetical protein